MFVSGGLFAQQEFSKSKAIYELMELSGAKEKKEQLVREMINTNKSENARVPEAAWQELEKKTDYYGSLKRMYVAYNRAYTAEEIQELLELYKANAMQEFKKKHERVEPALEEIEKHFRQNLQQQLKKKAEAY